MVIRIWRIHAAPCLFALATMDPQQSNPPYYILLAQSNISTSQTAPGPLSNNLVHPVINYHYEDDPLHTLLPSQPDEHVLVLNYDRDASQPTAHSLSGGLSILGVKKEEAPGAAVADAGTRNDGMYIIETISNDQCVYCIRFIVPWF